MVTPPANRCRAKKQHSLTGLLLTVLLTTTFFSSPVAAKITNAPSPSTTELNVTNQRNLFVEAGHSPQESSAKISATFQQLFHGNPATEAVYFAAGTNHHGPLAYIYDVANEDVRSEGVSYGMMIAVQLDKKAEFDALWNWAKSFMHHANPEHPAYGFYAWSVKTNGVANDDMPAPDGEQYFAMSLYFAAARWGNGNGIYNYHAEADRLLTDMKNRPLITGATVKGTLTAGALFEPDNYLVRFTPNVTDGNHTDPSYQLPAFYELWAKCGPPADRAFWAQAAQASRDFFQSAAHPLTGLTPDYANFDGTPWAAAWNPRSANFQYDAWRTAMNWSVDWAWWSKDSREKILSDRLQSFFEIQGMVKYGSRFTLAGNSLDDGHAIGLVAMNAVASLAATRPRAQKFVEALWKTPVPDGEYRYYNGLLYLLAQLHCGGEFKIWMPK